MLRSRKKLTGMLLLILALVAAPTIWMKSETSAEAYSSSARTAQYWYPHNGCSSPTGDSPSGVSFTDACNQHDGCYWGHWASKSTCDWWFYNNMRSACSWNAWCQGWALAYYRAVDQFGWPFYLCRCDAAFSPVR